MTILGKHTVDETLHLMKTVEFRQQAGDKVNATITPAFQQAFPDVYRKLQSDWANWKNRWAIARANVTKRLMILNDSQPLVPASTLPAEDEYRTIRKAINVGGEDTYTTGDLTDCLNRIETAAGTQIDEKNKPMPTGFDPDFAMYREVDAKIKAGEAAAREAADAAKKAAKSNIGLLVGLGVAGVVGTVVVTKIYL